ncbi:hypothetical protein HPB52_023978 [Rhipicephalus sanguineus]|uniref:Uncharacterized protein n=1 Tax=Rhipicephalus sanguineus TaxID=34632 RepID=A0A9D4Q400_RHISA|nr:hypothetical protein HPB52_023978 [Rhipicephalus sanguineus]
MDSRSRFLCRPRSNGEAVRGEVSWTQSAEDIPSMLARNAEDIASPFACSARVALASTCEHADRVSLDIPVLINVSPYSGDPKSTLFAERPAAMLPSLCPSVKPFNPAYPRAWFLQLDATLAVNCVTAQLLMHAVLINALLVELRHLSAASKSSPQTYDDL